MAAITNEKDGSFGSSVAAPRPNAARDLDERRRAALSQVDNATFSSVINSFPMSALTPSVVSQLVPCESLLCRRRWLFHRCVSGANLPFFFLFRSTDRIFQLRYLRHQHRRADAWLSLWPQPHVEH